MARKNSTVSLPHLRRRSGLRGGLKLAAGECCTLAIQALARRPNEKAVHRVRQACKRARAILRLMEDAGVKDVTSLRERLAEAGRKFSQLRDATVVATLMERFVEKTDGDAKAVALANRLKRKKPQHPSAAWWTQRRQELAKLRRDIQQLAAGELSPHQVDESLRASVRRVRRHARWARRDHRIETAHDWRKKVILLREQVSVARPVLGGETPVLHDRLQRLAKRLGKAVDWQVFIAAAKSGTEPANRAEKKWLKTAARKQQRALKRARKAWRKVERVLQQDFP